MQTTKTNADTQRWTIVNGVIRLAARKEFVLFLSYGRQGARAFIRKERRGELLQSCEYSTVDRVLISCTFSYETTNPF